MEEIYVGCIGKKEKATGYCISFFLGGSHSLQSASHVSWFLPLINRYAMFNIAKKTEDNGTWFMDSSLVIRQLKQKKKSMRVEKPSGGNRGNTTIQTLIRSNTIPNFRKHVGRCVESAVKSFGIQERRKSPSAMRAFPLSK